MRLGIMQPYFFPYLGYFSLIKYCDKFIFFDTPQYISHGWINRNRILKQDGTVGYITVPIKKARRETSIMDIQINDTEKWRERIYGQLAVYKKRAPYYRQALELVKSVLETECSGMLSQLCISSVMKTWQYLGLESKFEVFSKMNLLIGKIEAPDEWALKITKASGFDTYVNPPGGMSFFDFDKYRKQNITLEFLQPVLKPYIQRIGHFVSGLSIIDVMMFNSAADINEQLRFYTIADGTK